MSIGDYVYVSLSLWGCAGLCVGEWVWVCMILLLYLDRRALTYVFVYALVCLYLFVYVGGFRAYACVWGGFGSSVTHFFGSPFLHSLSLTPSLSPG